MFTFATFNKCILNTGCSPSPPSTSATSTQDVHLCHLQQVHLKHRIPTAGLQQGYSALRNRVTLELCPFSVSWFQLGEQKQWFEKNTMRLFYTKKSSPECTFWNQLLVLHHWTSIWIRSLMKKKIISGFSRGQNALITWCIECITLNPFGVKCTFPVTGLLHCCNDALSSWFSGGGAEQLLRPLSARWWRPAIEMQLRCSSK